MVDVRASRVANWLFLSDRGTSYLGFFLSVLFVGHIIILPVVRLWFGTTTMVIFGCAHAIGIVGLGVACSYWQKRCCQLSGPCGSWDNMTPAKKTSAVMLWLFFTARGYGVLNDSMFLLATSWIFWGMSTNVMRALILAYVLLAVVVCVAARTIFRKPETPEERLEVILAAISGMCDPTKTAPVWHLLSYCLPTRARRESFEPSFEDLKRDILTARAKYNGRLQKCWLAACFNFRALILIPQSLGFWTWAKFLLVVKAITDLMSA